MIQFVGSIFYHFSSLAVFHVFFRHLCQVKKLNLCNCSGGSIDSLSAPVPSADVGHKDVVWWEYFEFTMWHSNVSNEEWDPFLCAGRQQAEQCQVF